MDDDTVAPDRLADPVKITDLCRPLFHYRLPKDMPMPFARRVLPALLSLASLWACVSSWGQDNSGCTAPRPDAPVNVPLANASFDTAQDGRPKDWKALEHRVPGNYAFELDTNNPHSPPTSALIRQVHTEDYGTLQQVIKVQPCWIGKTARLSAYLRSENANGGGGALVMHATAGSAILSWNHMNDNRVKGSQPWKLYSIEVGIPPGTYALEPGVMLEDDGKLWADDVKLEIIDAPAAPEK